MFCEYCGNRIEPNAQFCGNCGNKHVNDASSGASVGATVDNATTSTPISSVHTNKQQGGVSISAEAKPRSRKNLLKWILPAIALSVVLGLMAIIGIAALANSSKNQKEAKAAAEEYVDKHYWDVFDYEVVLEDKTDKTDYIFNCDVSHEHALWKSTGLVKLRVYKGIDEWSIEVVEENIEYVFESNNNWYYVTDSGNGEYLVKIIELSEDEATLEYYMYDLPNDYDHGFITVPVEYDGEEYCFVFGFKGDWRIKGDYIQYNKYEVGAHYEYYQSGDFNSLKPVNPDDYWWYEKAKRQSGNYDSDLATDISQAKVGDIVSIGKYEMDNDTSNGLDNITWLVIDENDSGILVISKYCIAQQEPRDVYKTWENSDTREWLNGEFYNNAFTSDEKGKIITSTVVNADNAETEADGGNDTLDKLYLLSNDEVNKYFASKDERKAYGTLYLQELVDEGSGAFGWWLRTPGKDYEHQCYVGSNGYLYTEGCSVAVYNNGLRPAMWISK